MQDNGPNPDSTRLSDLPSDELSGLLNTLQLSLPTYQMELIRKLAGSVSSTGAKIVLSYSPRKMSKRTTLNLLSPQKGSPTGILILIDSLLKQKGLECCAKAATKKSPTKKKQNAQNTSATTQDSASRFEN